MIKFIYTLLFFAMIFHPGYSTAQSNNPQVDSVIHEFMTRWDIPGLSFSMAYDRTILYSKGYGYANISASEPVTEQSLFRIASCSKPFTATAIMLLIQNNQLQLTDTVFGPHGILNQAQYQTILDSNVLKITVENLLEHTGGWDDTQQIDPMFYSTEISEWANLPPPAMQPTIIEYALSQLYLIHPPGTYYAYSNFGYCVLGRVIEKITGTTYEDFIRQKILIPCGAVEMKLGKNLASQKFPNEVHYYGCPGEETAPSVIDTNEIVPWPYGGFNILAMDSHGEWIASSNDLLRFVMAIHENRIISQHTYNIMVTPPAVNPTYAKGWGVNSTHNIWHMGSLPGTSSEIVKASNKYMWSIVMNKRNVNQQSNFENDIDDLGWTIQNFLPPPAVQDSCFVFGPTFVTANTVNVYSTSLSGTDWTIANYDGANAHVSGTSGHEVNVNSGTQPGYYTIYKTSADISHTVLCSLMVSVDAVLPVEMQSLSAVVTGRTASLSWVTSSELNNRGFEVQRFDNADSKWKAITFIAGRGSSSVPVQYNYPDVNLPSGRYKYRLKQIDYNGSFDFHEFRDEAVVGAPAKFYLSENYPNPFNPVTRINFDIPVSGNVKLIVFDVAGREIRTLLNETREPGFYTMTFDAGMLSSGVYFYRLETGSFVMTRKMLLVK